MRTFTLTQEQYERALAFEMENLPPPTTIGGGFTFCFTPNSIGIVVNVRTWNGKELDLTDYESW